MDAANDAVVYFSHHALSLKGLPILDPSSVRKYFSRNDVNVIDDKLKLADTITKLISNKQKPVFLLLMSSGTFDGIDWNAVSSH